MGVRGTAIDIIEPASKLTQDWILQLKNQGNYKVGVAMPANIRRISSWIKPNKKYRISFSYFENGRVRDIIINDIAENQN